MKNHEIAATGKMIAALAELKDAYNKVEAIWCDAGCNLNDTAAISYYPFEQSFDEVNIPGWVTATIEELMYRFEIDGEEYTNTGGHCMVAEMLVHYYNIGEKVFISCNAEMICVLKCSVLSDDAADEDNVLLRLSTDDELAVHEYDGKYRGAIERLLTFWLENDNQQALALPGDIIDQWVYAQY